MTSPRLLVCKFLESMMRSLNLFRIAFAVIFLPAVFSHAQTAPTPQPSQVSQALELSKATGRPIFVMAGRET